MNILVLLAHPQINKSRVNRTWVQHLQQYPEVTIHNLYEEYYNFPINIYRERRLLLMHDRIVFQFPLFFYSAPSLLKQWQDEVLSYVWSKNEGIRLRDKELLLAISTGAPESAYQAGGFHQYTIEELMRPFEMLAKLNGMKFLPIFAFYNANEATDEEIKQSAQQYVEHLFQNGRDKKNQPK